MRVRILTVLLAAGCATTGSSTARGPDAEIPVFAKDDPRVETAGFVAQTLRLHEERNGTRFTLMAFAVGETLTLGAMVRGAFQGEVRWQIGDRALSFPFDTEAALADVPVSTAGTPSATLRGQGAAFRGTSWVNIDLPLAEWGADGTPLQLTFTARAGDALSLPDEGYHYVMRHAQVR